MIYTWQKKIEMYSKICKILTAIYCVHLNAIQFNNSIKKFKMLTSIRTCCIRYIAAAAALPMRDFANWEKWNEM